MVGPETGRVTMGSLGYETALVLLTDALWTLVSIAGVRYGWPTLVHSEKAFRYSNQAFPRRPTREQFRRARRMARCLLYGVIVAMLLGVLIIGGDVYDLLTGTELTTNVRRMIYRFVLISVMGSIVWALRELYKTYEVWET